MSKNTKILSSTDFLILKSLITHLDAINSELPHTVERTLVDQMTRHLYLQGVIDLYWAETPDLFGLRWHLDFILKKHEMAVYSSLSKEEVAR